MIWNAFIITTIWDTNHRPYSCTFWYRHTVWRRIWDDFSCIWGSKYPLRWWYLPCTTGSSLFSSFSRANNLRGRYDCTTALKFLLSYGKLNTKKTLQFFLQKVPIIISTAHLSKLYLMSRFVKCWSEFSNFFIHTPGHGELPQWLFQPK